MNAGTITKDLIAQHNLTDDEYKKIVEILGREPNMTELGMFSVMWSEHCSYKSSRVHLKKLPTTGPRVVQGPGENAGAVDIGEGLCVVFKMESHNHPSFIEPYQGAATGVGGIMRDVFTMGARPIALLNSLRFGQLDTAKNRHLMKGVVAGIAGYGNCLSGKERVLIRVNGSIRNLTFDDLNNEFFSGRGYGSHQVEKGLLQVLSFDPNREEACWVGVRACYKLKAGGLLKIKTTMGRELAVTSDHPTVIVKEGKFIVIPAHDLAVGSTIPVATKLPEDDPRPKECDLLDVFKESKLNIYVRLPRNVEIPLEAIRQAVKGISDRSRYRTRRTMPLAVYREVEQEIGISRRAVDLYIPSGKANYIAGVLPMTAAVARLIGYYLSEGCVSRNGSTYKIIWTFAKHEQEYVDDVTGILKTLAIRYSVYHRKRTIAITVSSWCLGIVFRDYWKTGTSAVDKSIPDFIFSCSPEMKVEVLKGLFRGDGSVSAYPSGSRIRIRFATSSATLFDQVVLLLQDQGLVPFLYRGRQQDSHIAGRFIRGDGEIFHLEFNNYADVTRMSDWFSNALNEKIKAGLAEYPNQGRRFSYPRFQKHTHFSTVTVKNIEQINCAQDVYDLEVDDPHLFVTTSGTITHNCMGVPTVGGEVRFDDIYSFNPLVNAFCLGIAHKDKIFLGTAAGVGNPVIYFGSKTGRDGIHGATMASDSFDDKSEQKRPTVQVGDPFQEKLLLEACLELMSADLLVGIQDMGAAGLTSSSCEMASRAGNGIELDLTDVPRREPGMTPYELMLSESQERMLMVAKAGKEDDCIKICKKWDLDVAVVGKVTGDGILRVIDQGQVVAEIPAKSLADDGPRYERPYSPPAYQDMLTNLNYDAIADVKDANAALLSLLESPTIASKRWVYEQYDHMVRTNTMVRPGSDAAVVRIKGTNKAVAMTVDCNGRYCLLHPYEGTRLAVVEAARNLVCSGAEPIGLTDCLNFGNPERPDVMWQFVLAIEGLKDACEHFKIPIVSGNVSFYNETNGLSIYPTPMLGMVGLIEHADRAMTQWFKDEGDVILLIGKTRDDLGGSEYLRVMHHREQGSPPFLSLETEKALQDFILKVVHEGQVQSAHDCSDGGLAVALAECCVSAPCARQGAVIRLPLDSLRRDALLFGESQSRVIFSAKPDQAESILNRAQDSGIPAMKLGTVGGSRIVIDVEKGQWTEGCRIDIPVDEAFDRWAFAIERMLNQA
jgi:phosphoribosylformylglycinamidine synthase subunit PurL